VGLFDGGRQKRAAFSIGISLRIHHVLCIVLGSVASGCVVPQVRVLLLVHLEFSLCR
jgi:hypothetical protein